MARPRVRVVGRDEEGNFDVEAALSLLQNTLATMIEFGGMVLVTADREQVGTVEGEPVFETVGLVLQYTEHFPVAPPRADEETEREPEPEAVSA